MLLPVAWPQPLSLHPLTSASGGAVLPSSLERMASTTSAGGLSSFVLTMVVVMLCGELERAVEGVLFFVGLLFYVCVALERASVLYAQLEVGLGVLRACWNPP